MPTVILGPLYGVSLQMLANGIIDPAAKEEGKSQKDKKTFYVKHIVVKAGTLV